MEMLVFIVVYVVSYLLDSPANKTGMGKCPK